LKRSWIKPSKKPKRIEERRLDSLFQQACKLRDGNRCQVPGCNRLASGGVHHLIPRKYKAVRHYMPNGVSLCIEHHVEIHEGKDKLNLRLQLIMNLGSLKFRLMEDYAQGLQKHMNFNAQEHLENFIKEHGKGENSCQTL
jgi:hypothetical protein